MEAAAHFERLVNELSEKAKAFIANIEKAKSFVGTVKPTGDKNKLN